MARPESVDHRRRGLLDEPHVILSALGWSRHPLRCSGLGGALGAVCRCVWLDLRKRGYPPLTCVSQLRQVARLSRWAEASGLTVGELTSQRINATHETLFGLVDRTKQLTALMPCSGPRFALVTTATRRNSVIVRLMRPDYGPVRPALLPPRCCRVA